MCVGDGMRLDAVKFGVDVCVEPDGARKRRNVGKTIDVPASYTADLHHTTKTRMQQLLTPLLIIDVDLPYCNFPLDIILHNAERNDL